MTRRFNDFGDEETPSEDNVGYDEGETPTQIFTEITQYRKRRRRK